VIARTVIRGARHWRTGAMVDVAISGGLIEWVREHKHVTRAADGSDRNWRFATVKTAGPIVFTSAAGKIDLANKAGLGGVRWLKDNGDGFATYALDLAAKQQAKRHR